MFWVELLDVLLYPYLGTRIGGMGFRWMGGIGLCILPFVFHHQPRF